jgi:hypothetical protein
MIVSGLQSSDIALAHSPGIAQTLPSPRKPLAPEPHHQKIRHEAGVAAVSIREGMNLHQPVMEAHRDLIRRIGVAFNPSFGVVQQLAQSHGNLPVRYSDIAFAGPELPVVGPFEDPLPNRRWTMSCRSSEVPVPSDRAMVSAKLSLGLCAHHLSVSESPVTKVAKGVSTIGLLLLCDRESNLHRRWRPLQRWPRRLHQRSYGDVPASPFLHEFLDRHCRARQLGLVQEGFFP